mmetsp:Transcript_19008/g.25364  ORF Transcript_19008/g.25364 Transcript_19008/m.25364 type:complete len:234 (-) Transcript_19008:208-909(-)
MTITSSQKKKKKKKPKKNQTKNQLPSSNFNHPTYHSHFHHENPPSHLPENIPTTLKNSKEIPPSQTTVKKDGPSYPIPIHWKGTNPIPVGLLYHLPPFVLLLVTLLGRIIIMQIIYYHLYHWNDLGLPLPPLPPMMKRGTVRQALTTSNTSCYPQIPLKAYASPIKYHVHDYDKRIPLVVRLFVWHRRNWLYRLVKRRFGRQRGVRRGCGCKIRVVRCIRFRLFWWRWVRLGV